MPSNLRLQERERERMAGNLSRLQERERERGCQATLAGCRREREREREREKEEKEEPRSSRAHDTAGLSPSGNEHLQASVSIRLRTSTTSWRSPSRN